jgi:hypothetical protein
MVWGDFAPRQAGSLMRTQDLALAQGMADTRATLVAWNLRPWPVLREWLRASLLVAAGLLLAVWAVGSVSTPDVSPLFLPGISAPPQWDDVLHVLGRNSLVLALHGFACVAGFIAGSSLPLSAERYSGTWRWIHDRAGPLAIAFVMAATAFSLLTQAYAIGLTAADVSAALGISTGLLLLGLLPHALPELVALFLPLAAWIIASRRGQWHELLAATFVTVALAVPVLVVSALVETYVSPHLLAALAGR